MAERQVLRMARPASYWARRAAFHHRRGDRRQAEALYRHAVALTPDSIPLKLSYARVLQELGCYEASNRQAFAALAQDPECASCVFLIGQNLAALGYLEEAADAFAHALQSASGSMAEACDEQLDRLEELLGDPPDCGVRYRILVQRAAEDVSVGEWESARRMLRRACAMPRRDERCHALLSLCYKAQDKVRPAIREAAAACHAAPQSCAAYCALAELYGADHRRGKALKTLLLAAARVLTADDERLLCRTAPNLRFPAVPLPALSRLGGRVHTLFNQAVLLLAAGQAQRALRALDRCRALDPDDVPARRLHRTAQALAVLPRGQAMEYARGLRLYPELSDADGEACYRDFMQALGDGADAFARRLQADESLYRLTLYQAENPHADISGVLEQVIPHLSENFTLKLLREILLLPAGGIAEKQLAIRILMSEQAKPFVLWHNGRLSFIKPHGAGETDETLRLKDLLIRYSGAGCDAGLMTHALRLIRRMPRRMRGRIAAERGDDFFLAVRMHYARALPAAAAQQAVPRLRHVVRLCRMLARIAPHPNQTVVTPHLWLSQSREDQP